MKRCARLCIFALTVLFASFSLTPPVNAQVRGKALYDKLVKEQRSLVKFEGLRSVDWTPDGLSYYLSKDDTFIKVDAETGREDRLFDDVRLIDIYNTLTGEKTNKLPFKRFRFLNGGNKIHFTVGARSYIYDRESGRMTAYVPEPETLGVRGRMYGEVLSPDLKYRAYTRDYNLYVKTMEGKETQLTTGGHKDLRKGFPDWVYPEELAQYDVFWWSPDSTRIAYMQFDEYPVRKYPIVHDVDPVPQLEMQSYPKSGANNPIITFFIVDVKTKKTIRIESGMESNIYLLRGQWTPDGKLFTYQRLNRLQNKLELFAADPASGKSRLILTDEDPCYVETDFDLHFLRDNRHFLWTSERTGWNEIYLYDINGKLVKQITDAKLPVDSILAVDEEGGWITFSGAETRGLESHAYRVKMDGSGFSRLTKAAGTHRVAFSSGGKYFTDMFTSFDTPMTVTLHRGDGRQIRELGKSQVSQEFLDLNLIAPEHFIFKSADGKYDLDGVLYKPAHFDRSEQYPLIMSVYGGPGAKRVFNRYLFNDGNQTLAQLGFIVVSIDHRGISRRGKAFQNLMYMNLGQIELEDHVAAAKFVGAKPFVDAGRVGIFGHSYGGYMTCIAMLKAPDVFHVGVAGAPVTDWRNYDSIYTERYMRRPQDNPEGYRLGSCMTFAKDLKGRLSIHHGAVDDNVHPGNTIQLVQELLKHNKDFDLMVYPEQQHGIRFRRYREARVEFFIDNLKPDIK